MAKRKRKKGGDRFLNRQPDADGALDELEKQDDGQVQGSGTEEFAELEQSIEASPNEEAVEDISTEAEIEKDAAIVEISPNEEGVENKSTEDKIEEAQGDELSQQTPKEPSAFYKHFSAGVLWVKRRYFTALNSTYKYFYFVGIQLLRSTRIKRRHLLNSVRKVEQVLEERSEIRRHKIAMHFHNLWKGITAPFNDLRSKYKQFRRDLDQAKHNNPNAVRIVYKNMAVFLLGGLWRTQKFLLNYIAPIAGIVAFFMTVNYFSNQTLALRVEYNGKDLGYIMDESIFNQAENEMKGRIINETYIKPDDIIPKFELKAIQAEQLISVDDLTDKLIQASGNELEEADGLYIQNKFVSAVTDGEALLIYMNGMREKYRTRDMDDSIKIEFVKKIQVKRGLYPVSSIKPLDEVKELLNSEEKGERRYTVVDGDDGLTIAAKNGISFSKLKSLNPDVETSLFPGDEMLISQSVPFLGVQVTTTSKYEEEMPFEIKQKTDATKTIGWTKVTQKGQKGLKEVTEEIKMIDGFEVERNIVNTEVIQEPVDQILVVGGNKPLKVIPSNSSGGMASGTFGWPMAGGSITTGFLGYYGHTGADITFSGCAGAPIYASAAGTVVASGWGGPYGYRVIINHGGNVQTLYAHCSRLFVGVGQQVSQGEQIAAVGRTGNASGPHLHFEIRINGTPRNPAPYLYS
ncbi:peptidoglycan DD-metalloendopeptidase family protein [Oscillospiraceae bacterium PP1C4]